jgi:hypothetical protein
MKTSSFKSCHRQQHDVLVKGIGYQPPFGAGAGNVHFELPTYVSASLDWILTKHWTKLQIKPLPQGQTND